MIKDKKFSHRAAAMQSIVRGSAALHESARKSYKEKAKDMFRNVINRLQHECRTVTVGSLAAM